MTPGQDDDVPAGDSDPGEAGRDYQDGLGLTRRPLLSGRAGAPLWMRAELVRLRAAFPAFSFSIRPGQRGLTFEAWREDGSGGLYAVITQDPAELRRELDDTGASGLRPVADRSGNGAR